MLMTQAIGKKIVNVLGNLLLTHLQVPRNDYILAFIALIGEYTYMYISV